MGDGFKPRRSPQFSATLKYLHTPQDLSMREVCLVLLLFLPSYPVAFRGQSTNGSISGRVIDRSQAVIADAKVAAISTDINPRYETATNRS
jgi:hypothetical protein